MAKERRGRGRPPTNPTDPDDPDFIKPRSFRLPTSTMTEITAIRAAKNLGSDAEVIRLLARQEANDLKRKGLL